MKAIKWTAIILGGLIALVIVALLVIPLFVDIQKYKPEIEQKVSDATGRPFRVGGDLSLSLFPLAGLALSDVHLGNPAGFEDKDFVSVDSFEVRLRLLPLISKKVEVEKFILDSPRIELIRGKDGKANWEGLGQTTEPPAEKPKAPEGEKPARMPIKSLTVDEFLIRNGSVLYVDRATETRREIRDFRLELEDLSLDEPIEVELSALLDGEPVSVEGKVGPLGETPGKGLVPLEVHVKALKQLDLEMTGTIQDAVSDAKYDLNLAVSKFSPKKLMAALGQPFPVATGDPGALDSLALKAKIKGGKKNVEISEGALDLDESKISFSARVKDFEKPDLSLDLNVDKIDVDRYLPPSGEGQPGKQEETPPQDTGKKADYEPLRRVVLDGKITIDHLRVKGADIQNMEMKITGRDGVFTLDPLAMELYKGHLSGNGTFDVRSETPKASAKLDANGIEVNPLVNDMFQKDFIEGMFVADLSLDMEGAEAQQIRKTLNGKGELVFTDGAIKGVNLTDLVQKLKSATGLAGTNVVGGRTDFSELRVPFNITDGLLQTSETSMTTPLLRLEATGKADLVKETLDFRVVPKLVATLKGKGDTEDRSGVLVPFLVTGTFASPLFVPDVKGVAKEQLEKKVDDLLKSEEGNKVKEKAGEILKKLPLGQ